MPAATPALKDVSKTELAEAYSKLKSRTTRANQIAKQEGEALVRDALTVGSAAGLGLLMGYMAKGETDPTKIKEAQQVAGFDIDLVVGGAAAAIGLMKYGGKMSDTMRAVGVGGLCSWASRAAEAAGAEM